MRLVFGKGTTIQKFFPDVLKSVYSLRLKGEQHLEGYNFQRSSANIKLLNEEMAEEVNAIEMFDLMEINCAMVEKDMITITDLEIKRVLDKKGVNEKEKEEEEKEVEPAQKRRKLDENESDETRLG